ncbi:class A beta-lactamase [Acidisphaera sp. L21]|uniref:class A beta-lactamase n=1 Tax=Acidisphaera sp. L21 TaxID=1641851 RepID=UPI00131D34E4|nr:class A beta-lactamase [Acidisphaera sp. L21]
MIGRRALLAAGAGLLAAAAPDGLPQVFAAIEARRGGRLGVAVLDTATGRTAGYRQDERFPMCSTAKLPTAGAVLAHVGVAGLQRRIHFPKHDLVVHSPLTAPHADTDGMTLDAICAAALSQSDNTAGNLMLHIIGGPAGLTRYLRTLGDEMTRLDRWETALNEAKPGDVRDTTTPAAMLADIQALTLGHALPAPAKASLLGWLRGNQVGDARLRARLPPGWQVADKTGTGDFRTSNDAGLLFPPNGAPPIIVAAYLTEGSADDAVREAALADVGAAVAAWA